jgi:hypothetical protein
VSVYLYCVDGLFPIYLIYFPGVCSGKEETQRPGVYLQAFCNGLNEVLVPYRNDIVKLEEKGLEDPYLPLLTVVSKVEEYTKLFEVLNSMIKQVRRFCMMYAHTTSPCLAMPSFEHVLQLASFVQIFNDNHQVYLTVACETFFYMLEFWRLCVCARVRVHVLATCVCFKCSSFGCSLLLQISEQHIHGCQILDVLHREVTCNVNAVKEPLRWLVFSVCVGSVYGNKIAVVNVLY